MFSIAYNKQTKFIVYWRSDNSTTFDKTSAQQHLEIYCNLNDLDASNFDCAELSWDGKTQYIVGRDMYDETTNTIYADPDWVAPTPTE